MTRYEYVTREIGVPTCVLTAADCDTAKELPQWVPLTGRRAEFQVPELPSDTENVVLQVPLPDGEKMDVSLPERCREGDTLCLLQRHDETWKVVPKQKRFRFVVPPGCQPRDVLTLQPTERLALNFRMPDNVEAFNVVTLAREADDSWILEQCAVLPPMKEPFEPDWTTGQYQSILDALKSKGFLDEVSPDASGTLNVSVPFCGHFHEYVVLGNFLAEHQEYLGAKHVSIFGMELFDDYIRDWALAERWLWHTHGISCCIEAGDLAQEPTPFTQWVIGIHPEVTKGGPWFRIIGSLLRSCSGLLTFATFYEEEKETLLNMIEMYKTDKAQVDTFENPFYASSELGPHPAMRFIIVVSHPLKIDESRVHGQGKRGAGQVFA